MKSSGQPVQTGESAMWPRDSSIPLPLRLVSPRKRDQRTRVSDAYLLAYMGGLYRCALVLSRDSTAASDLVLETYVRALKSGRRPRRDSNARARMFTILRNLWLSESRKIQNSSEAAKQDPAAIIHRISAEKVDDLQISFVQKADADWVRKVIGYLPEDFREIVILREYEGMSFEEIAGVMGYQLEQSFLTWQELVRDFTRCWLIFG